MALIARDPRLPQRQIYEHDLSQKGVDQLLAILIIEVRRLREDLALYNGVEPPPEGETR